MPTLHDLREQWDGGGFQSANSYLKTLLNSYVTSESSLISPLRYIMPTQVSWKMMGKYFEKLKPHWRWMMGLKINEAVVMHSSGGTARQGE